MCGLETYLGYRKDPEFVFYEKEGFVRYNIIVLFRVGVGLKTNGSPFMWSYVFLTVEDTGSGGMTNMQEKFSIKCLTDNHDSSTLPGASIAC